MSKVNILKRIERIEELINSKTSNDIDEAVALHIRFEDNEVNYFTIGDREATPKEEKELMKRFTKKEPGAYFNIVFTDD